MFATEVDCEECGQPFFQGCVVEHLEYICGRCRAIRAQYIQASHMQNEPILWDSNNTPITAKQGKVHPNGSATFHITDEAWLTKNGWGKESYVEVQARPMPPDRSVPKDTYAWEP